MGDRTVWLDDVRRICYLIRELHGSVYDAQAPTGRRDGSYRTRHTPDQRDWRLRSGSLYDGSDAYSSSVVDERYAACNIRNEPVGTASLCGAPYQPEPRSQK